MAKVVIENIEDTIREKAALFSENIPSRDERDKSIIFDVTCKEDIYWALKEIIDHKEGFQNELRVVKNPDGKVFDEESLIDLISFLEESNHARKLVSFTTCEKSAFKNIDGDLLSRLTERLLETESLTSLCLEFDYKGTKPTLADYELKEGCALEGLFISCFQEVDGKFLGSLRNAKKLKELAIDSCNDENKYFDIEAARFPGSLSSLDLACNNIVFLPENLFTFVDEEGAKKTIPIEVLGLADNFLSDDSQLERLMDISNSLTSLTLSGNDLRSIPCPLLEMERLTQITLGNNRIERLPDEGKIKRNSDFGELGIYLESNFLPAEESATRKIGNVTLLGLDNQRDDIEPMKVSESASSESEVEEVNPDHQKAGVKRKAAGEEAREEGGPTKKARTDYPGDEMEEGEEKPVETTPSPEPEDPERDSFERGGWGRQN